MNWYEEIREIPAEDKEVYAKQLASLLNWDVFAKATDGLNLKVLQHLLKSQAAVTRRLEGRDWS